MSAEGGGSDDGGDDAAERQRQAEKAEDGRLRVVLGGRCEVFVFLADFDEHPGQSWRETVHGVVGLKLPSLAQAIFAELIDEGDFERVRTRFGSGAVDRVRRIYADILERAAAGLCPAGRDPVRFHIALAAVAKPLPAAEVLGEEYADQQEFVVNVLLDGFKVEAAG